MTDPKLPAAIEHECALAAALLAADLPATFSMRRAADAGYKLAASRAEAAEREVREIHAAVARDGAHPHSGDADCALDKITSMQIDLADAHKSLAAAERELEALREDKARLDAIIASASDVHWCFDEADGRYRIGLVAAGTGYTGWHDDPRAAIDAARQPKAEPAKEGEGG